MTKTYMNPLLSEGRKTVEMLSLGGSEDDPSQSLGENDGGSLGLK